MSENAYPLQATVTKALRRDAGIIAQQSYNRKGYRVRGGKDRPVSIYPDLTDVMDMREDINAARDLGEHLELKGWDVTVNTEAACVVVRKVPTAADIRKIEQEVARQAIEAEEDSYDQSDSR